MTPPDSSAQLATTAVSSTALVAPVAGELIAFPTGRYAIPDVDMADFGLHGTEEQERVKFLLTLFAKMEAGGITPMSKALAFQLRASRGYGEHNLRTFYYRWKEGGWRAVVRKFTSGGERLPVKFVQHWKAECERNGRSMSQARQKIIRDWMNGVEIPGYGTWRDWFFDQFPTRDIPDICPGTPKGWGKSNLYSLQPTKAQRALTTRGFAHAKPHLLSMVRDPSNLLPLQLVVIDDFELDQNCFYFDPATGIRSICQMSGVAAMDVATRRIIGFILKPRLKIDPADKNKKSKKQSITRAEVRLLLFGVIRDHGIPAHGMTIYCENAAAAVTTELELTFRNLFGGRIAIARTGVLDQAVLKAGFKDSGGKPWLKGWIESFFNLMHNVAAGVVQGNKGANYIVAPADLKEKQRVTERLIGTGPRDARLSDTQLAKARVPFQSATELCDLYLQIFSWIEARTDHEMMGFKDVREWRRDRGEAYRHWDELAQLTEDEQCAITDYNLRKQSPRERWNELYPTITRSMPAAHVLLMLLLTPRKGTLKNHKITFDHNSKGYTWLVPKGSAILDLKEGSEVLCYFDPARAARAHVCRLDGRALGEVTRWGPVDIADQDAITEAEKQIATFIAEQLAIVRARPLHQETERQLLEDKAINDGLVQEAEALRNTDGLTKTLNRTVPATENGQVVTATGDNAVRQIVTAAQEAASVQRADKALAQSMQRRADRLTEADKDEFLSNDEKPAAPAATGATGPANEAGQDESLADYI